MSAVKQGPNAITEEPLAKLESSVLTLLGIIGQLTSASCSLHLLWLVRSAGRPLPAAARTQVACFLDPPDSHSDKSDTRMSVSQSCRLQVRF